LNQNFAEFFLMIVGKFHGFCDCELRIIVIRRKLGELSVFCWYYYLPQLTLSRSNLWLKIPSFRRNEKMASIQKNKHRIHLEWSVIE
jgi:hypothetical protein